MAFAGLRQLHDPGRESISQADQFIGWIGLYKRMKPGERPSPDHDPRHDRDRGEDGRDDQCYCDRGETRQAVAEEGHHGQRADRSHQELATATDIEQSGLETQPDAEPGEDQRR